MWLVIHTDAFYHYVFQLKIIIIENLNIENLNNSSGVNSKEEKASLCFHLILLSTDYQR